MADPGFPIGDADLVGDPNSWCGYISGKKYNVKRKESEPFGVARSVDGPFESTDDNNTGY